VPLPGYSAADFTPISGKSGLHMPVSWKGGATLETVRQPVRVRVDWSGENQEKVRLFAIYLEPPSPAAR
jgi:hypothetical protein